MLRQIAEGVLVHESEFIRSNAVVVQGPAGLLLIDPGLSRSEMETLANDLRDLGQPVLAGFATHGHWDVSNVVPGHGSVGGPGQARARIDLDRAYVEALRAGTDPVDPRIGPTAKDGWELVSDVHAGQLQGLSQRGENETP